MEYIILALLWLAYFFLHSLLSSAKWKGFVESAGISNQLYRFVYSVLSFVLFILIFLYSGSTENNNLWDVKIKMSKYFGLMITTIGLMIIMRSFKSMSMMCFIGIKKQLQEKLIITGIHEYVRHPIYSGILLMMIGFVLYSNSIQSLIILMTTTLYLPFGIRWEEQKLVKEYGEQYENYKSDTPPIIPKVTSHFFL